MDAAKLDEQLAEGGKDDRPGYRKFQRRFYRWVFAVLSVAFCSWIAVDTLFDWSAASKGAFEYVQFDNRLQAALELRVAASRDLFQIALVLFGVLWGLVFAEERVAAMAFRRGLPEIIMFLAGSVALAGSMAVSLAYSISLNELLSDAVRLLEKPDERVVDFFGRKVNYLFTCQWTLLITGMLVTLLTFLSAKFLKEVRP